MADQRHADIVSDLDRLYADLHGRVRGDAELREVLKPLDDARSLIAKRRAALESIAEDHKAKRIASDQLPKLRAALLHEMKTAQDAAGKAVRARVSTLPAQQTERAFGTPKRGPETAEAKSDRLRLRIDAAEDVQAEALAILDAAVRTRDTLTLQLLASDWARGSCRHARTGRRPEPSSRRHGARIAESPDLLPEDRRGDLARLQRVSDPSKAASAGLNLLDLERTAAEPRGAGGPA